ncbi:hypothetical protein GCM10010399_23040 [Dactylosporangium fulvum]|uniref:Uncharacterized protein n=1 Tax=Dactylosporangium fulvum TaxID=53359 RepID=A0ABY5W2B9_9ACTN|nr:hypothetical protein [Dactylosporangium fulvum]UWP82211.1 hypothetical protein Dfulv_45315 [Dactylosporangium fulvum]
MTVDELTNRDQITLFALLAVARPASNRELRSIAGLEIDAGNKRRLKGYLESTKRGTTTVHAITKAGRDWCLTAMSAGRPADTKFPAGPFYAVLGGLGTYLVRTEQQLEDLFQPDPESWIRSVYDELTVRRKGQYVRLADVREWLDDDVDLAAELDRMVEQPDVHLKAELDQRKLTPKDERAAVLIGSEPRHLLKITSA